MTHTIEQPLICGRWPIVLQAGTGGFFEYLHTASAKNASAFLTLLCPQWDRLGPSEAPLGPCVLPQGLTVVEHFGGVGLFSTIIQEVLRPRMHAIFDLDPDCVDQLRSAFARKLVGLDGKEPLMSAMQGDAKLTMASIPGDLVVCDFPYATIKHHTDWPWDSMLAHKPMALIWSDTAARRIGLHRALYTTLFGSRVVSHEDYVRAYSTYIYDRYGYSISRCAYHVYSYLYATATPPGPIQFVKVTG